MDSWEIWFCVASLAQSMGYAWICVGFDPIVSETCFMITCNFEEEADGDGEDAAEYYILSYAKTYLVPKQQELQMAWEHRMEELKKEKG